MKHSVQDKGTLLLALIAGLSINGAFAALFSSIVPFSVFPILSLLLTVYWFNPLCWVAYFLFCRDVEQACDEAVIERMDTQQKKDYSAALLACSTSRQNRK